MIETLLQILAAFGTSAGEAGFNAAVDFNGDGFITVHDVLAFLADIQGGAKSAAPVTKG